MFLVFITLYFNHRVSPTTILLEKEQKAQLHYKTFHQNELRNGWSKMFQSNIFDWKPTVPWKRDLDRQKYQYQLHLFTFLNFRNCWTLFLVYQSFEEESRKLNVIFKTFLCQRKFVDWDSDSTNLPGICRESWILNERNVFSGFLQLSRFPCTD